MVKKPAENQISELLEVWHELESVYEEYAKGLGTQYSMLRVLSVLYGTKEVITQKDIAELSFIPKQTVNAIITNLYKNDYVELKELAHDRRNKSVSLTPSGEKYATALVQEMTKAERDSWSKLSKAQRSAIVDNMQLFKDIFRRALGMQGTSRKI